MALAIAPAQTWHDDLNDWLVVERKRAYLENLIIRAAQAHVMSWQAARRMLNCLPANERPCPYCNGLLELWHEDTKCWRCGGCGLLSNAH